MNFNKLLVKVSCTLFALSFLIIYIGCDTESSSYHHTKWTQYGGGPDQSKYFVASQITKENVNQMNVSWMYPSGDSLSYFFSPIIVDTIMYVMGKNFSLI